MNMTIVPLCRKKYPEFEQAQARLLELLELRNLSVHGQPFYTARYWCWETVPA
jgi:hypothetical protein